MKNSTIQRVIILGTIAIIGIMSVQGYWILRTWDMKQQQFEQTVKIALISVAKDVSQLKGSSLPQENLVVQRSSDYFVVNINDHINTNDLEFYLKREFDEVALNEDFEYGIYDCYNNTMVYGGYLSHSKGKIDKGERSDLPRYDQSPYYFGVRFPSRSTYLLNSMRLTIGFTAILFVAILFFLYSMFVILQQKRLSEMQKDFINNMTHEFKTPISTIKIAADVFLGTPVVQADSRLTRYAAIIREQNERLNNQVEKVLQLARIERDNFQLHLEPVDLHVLLKEISASVEVKIDDMNGLFSCDCNAPNALVSADRLHLTNIIHNLLDNALKYHKGVPEVSIQTAATDNGRKVQLVIADKGIGIDKEYHNKVFQKFFRVPTGNVHNVKGFGLGLFYVKNICDAHGWKIQLDSEPGQGTRVTIQMPVL